MKIVNFLELELTGYRVFRRKINSRDLGYPDPSSADLCSGLNAN